MNIYKIQQNLLAIFDELEENGGELTEELEQELALTQQDFKEKCKSYADVIKMTKADIAAIDEETKRLAALKKTKNNLIENLSKIMIEAIEMFGDTTNKGGKFVDYGTGKLSIRNSQKVELDENKAKCMASEYAKCIEFENMLGNASNRENITHEEIIQRCKEHKNTNLDVIVDEPYNVTRDDIDYSSFDISIVAGMEDMLCCEGYNAIKNLADVFGVSINITPKINKDRIKQAINSDEDISIGKIVPNQTLTIK